MTFPEAPLKRFGRIVGGATPRSSDELWGGGITWYTPTDVSKVHGGVLGESSRTLSREGFESCGVVAIPANSVVFTSRAPIGNVAITDRQCTTNQGCKTLIPARDTDPRFVVYCAIVRTAAMRAAGTGTTFLEVSGDRLGTVRFPKPQAALQRSIADFLDRESERISAIMRASEQAARVLVGQRGETFERFVADVSRVPLRYRLDGIDQGWSPECDATLAGPGEWGVLKVGCVNYGRFRPLEHKRLPDGLVPRPKIEVHQGDIIMSRANTRELVGSAAIVDDVADRRLMLCDKTYRLRLSRSVDRRFIALALESRQVRDQVEIATAGASSSMQNISQDTVRSLMVPDLPPGRQAEIVDQVQRRHAVMDRAVERLDELRRRLSEYRDALIVEAVTGERDVTKASETQMDERLQAAADGVGPTGTLTRSAR